MGRHPGHGSPAATTPEPAAKKEVLIFAIALASGLIAGELGLHGLEQLSGDQRGHGDFHPLFLRSMGASRLAGGFVFVIVDPPRVALIVEDRMDRRRVPLAHTCGFVASEIGLPITLARDPFLR
jgi:hypothetical protein